MYNQLVGSSVGKATPPIPRFPKLLIVLCVELITISEKNNMAMNLKVSGKGNIRVGKQRGKYQ